MPIPLAGAILGSAGISALGSVLGGILGSSAQESANSANLQAVRETNEQNKQLFERQLGWTEEMWNKSNVYNTPSAQRARYEQAGINPFLAMSNIQSGNAQAATTPAATPMQAGQVLPVDAMAKALPGIASSVGSGLVAYQDARMKENQIESVGIDNQIRAIDLRYKVQEKILELSERRAKIAESNASADYKKRSIALLDEQIDELSTSNSYLNQYLSERNRGQSNEADLKFEQLQSEKLAQDYQRMYTRMQEKLMKSQIFLNGAQSAQLAMSSKEIAESINQMKLNGASQRELNEYAKEQARVAIKKLGVDAKTAERIYNDYVPVLDPIINRIGKVGGFVLGVGGALFGARAAGSAAAAAGASRNGYGLSPLGSSSKFYQGTGLGYTGF